jgi:hypothetical protein
MESRKSSRRDFVHMSALTAAGALLAGCCPAAPTAPEKVVVTEIVEKEGEKVEVTKVVQVTTKPEEVVTVGGRIGEGVSIVFFPGGPAGGPFCTVVYNGAVQAARAPTSITFSRTGSTRRWSPSSKRPWR